MRALIAAVLAALCTTQAAAAAAPKVTIMSVTSSPAGPTFTPNPGYRYPGFTRGVAAAAVSITSSASADPDGHAAVWVEAEDSRGQWIQAGVISVGGKLPCAYAEVMHSGQHIFRCLFDVAFGTPVLVRITDSARHGWVAWVDGRPVISTVLGRSAMRVATGERYHGATLTYTLTPTI